MYQVALCDDEQIFIETQKKICCEALEQLELEYQITVFDSSEDFLHTFWEKGKRYELILLDIIMDGVNGMELARKIRETDSKATIIFITSSYDYALEGYDVQALHYLVKPVEREALKKLIISDCHARFQTPFFILDSGNGKRKVALRDIICMEIVRRQVEVTLVEGRAYYSGKLSDLLAQLPKERFVRCHQAFALNVQNIRELTRQDAITINGKKIPVSRTYVKEVKKAFAHQLR